MPNRPEFLVIGAQKCATTWLYKCLKEHPELYLPPYKRDVDHLASHAYQEMGVEHYFRNFGDATSEQKIVDVSVEYMFDKSCAELVHRHIPSPKFIVSLRNPIERAISAYYWSVRKGFIPDLPLAEGMQHVINGDGRHADANAKQIYKDILERGFYDLQINRYLEYFDISNFIFVLYDEIHRNPWEVIKNVYDFMGVSRSHRPSSIDSKPLVSMYFRPLLWFERLYGGSPGKQPSFIRRAFTKVADTTGQLMLKHGFRPEKPQIDARSRREMYAIYSPHVEQLQNILLRGRVIGGSFLSSLPDRWK